MKKGSTHQRADHVLRITNGEEPIGVSDDLPDACLFQVKMVPKWSERLVHFLTTADAKRLGRNCEERADFMLVSSKFQMIAGQLYYLGQDGILRLVACPNNYDILMKQAHVSSLRYHGSFKLTI